MLAPHLEVLSEEGFLNVNHYTHPPTIHFEGTMLVLSRHRDESIMIGDDVVVTIVDIRGDKVRLGIEAPQSIPVHRQEVYDAIQRENRKSAQTGPGTTKDVRPQRGG